MQISYVLTAGDMVDAYTRHGGAFLRVSEVIGVLASMAGVAGIVVAPGGLQGSIITILFGLFLLLRVRVTAELQFRRDLASGGEIRLTASDNGIEIHTARSAALLDWGAFRRYSESSKLFLLYLQSDVFQVVPKRAMAADEVVGFRGLLMQHLEKRPQRAARSSALGLRRSWSRLWWSLYFWRQSSQDGPTEANLLPRGSEPDGANPRHPDFLGRWNCSRPCDQTLGIRRLPHRMASARQRAGTALISSAVRSHWAQFAAASYVLCKNSSRVESGSAERRICS